MDGTKSGAPDALDENLDAADDALDARTHADDARVADRGDDGADAARAELGALNDRHLRLAAEFDNYRKRTERERAETWARAQADLAAGLLDVLDDMSRVSEMDLTSATAASVLEGLQLVERKLHRSLAAAGLEEIDPAGARFDPAEMDALMMVAAESPEDDDTVGVVMQKGYRFKGQLLRPARVQVRKYQG